MMTAFRGHWPEYCIEAALLGTFMICACAAVVIVEHPGSIVRARVRTPIARRAIIGCAMGLTAIALIRSPWGQRSGAHMNPAATLTFALLGKMRWADAFAYMLFQFLGAIAGVALAAALFPRLVRHDAVNCAITQPARRGRSPIAVALAAETAIAFVLFMTVLVFTNHADLAGFTPLVVGVLVALFITFEAPLSGMSMNPARTMGSALAAGQFRALWVYFTAPLLGMTSAAMLYVAIAGPGRVYCCKIDHSGGGACIFECRIAEMPGYLEQPAPAGGIRSLGSEHR